MFALASSIPRSGNHQCNPSILSKRGFLLASYVPSLTLLYMGDDGNEKRLNVNTFQRKENRFKSSIRWGQGTMGVKVNFSILQKY